MGNSNYLKSLVANMHKFSQLWTFCKLHGIVDKINKKKYDLPMQIKFLYLALFANFGHQSMHQVLQGTLSKPVLLKACPDVFPVGAKNLRQKSFAPPREKILFTTIYLISLTHLIHMDSVKQSNMC